MLAFLRRPWVSSRALRCGAHRGPACTPRCRFGSRPGSVARALGVQCHEIWHVVAGLLSDQLEPTGPVQPRKLYFFSFFTFVLLLLTHHSSWLSTTINRQPRYNSRASSFSLCDNHERCFCVWLRERAYVCLCVIVGSYNSSRS